MRGAQRAESTPQGGQRQGGRDGGGGGGGAQSSVRDTLGGGGPSHGGCSSRGEPVALAVRKSSQPAERIGLGLGG